jgi:hypothetical protein
VTDGPAFTELERLYKLPIFQRTIEKRVRCVFVGVGCLQSIGASDLENNVDANEVVRLSDDDCVSTLALSTSRLSSPTPPRNSLMLSSALAAWID